MRKVVVTEFLTLDGVMEAPEKWTSSFGNDEIAKYKRDELFASDALLLGRVTYQGFAAAWPSRTDESGFADRMNSLPKFVASTTLKEVEWSNSRLIKGNVAEEVSRLREKPGQNILIYGSGTLVRTLTQHDLIDEYRLLVYPIVLGSGKRLFKDGTDATLKLEGTQAFSSGVVALHYGPKKGEGGLEAMKYVDGYVLALPKRNLRTYRRMAQQAAKAWRKYGALEYFECAGDDLNPKWAGIKFPKTVRAKAGETVVLSFIVFKSRAHRDRVNAKVMKDPLMNDPAYKDKPMPFDVKRMVYGGFNVLVES